MSQLDRIVELLGGRRVLRRKLVSPVQLAEVVREGLPFDSAERLLRHFALSLEEASASLKVPARTLYRRKKLRARLEPVESEKLIRLARVADEAQEVLGDSEKASRWLRKPNRALGGIVPLSLLDTDVGAEAVLELLGRIQHGVYS